MLGPEDLCRRGRSCPRRLTFAGAGVAAPGVVTVAGAGVVAPGSLRPPKCEPRRSGRRLPPVPSPARISASPVWALHSCAGVTHGPGMCGHPLRGRDAWPRRKIPARAPRMAPGILQMCVSAMCHGALWALALHKTPPLCLQRKQSVRRTPQPVAAGDHLARRPSCVRIGLDAVWVARAQHTVTRSAPPNRIQIHNPQTSSQKFTGPQDHRRTRIQAHWDRIGRRRRTAATCLSEARPSDG